MIDKLEQLIDELEEAADSGADVIRTLDEIEAVSDLMDAQTARIRQRRAAATRR